ncbi:MAG TPA: phosphopentomutase, partial [Pirellulales bacterium]|nr:phosphopentomutase [Pirellulales bacterium]
LRAILSTLAEHRRGMVFVNLVDFDMIYGHRRDVPGFAKALEEFDRFLPTFEQQLGERDLVVVAADHGIDPTYRGTDHTREYIPLLVYQKGAVARDLGTRDTYADIGQTAVHALTGQPQAMPAGRSFLPELLSR